MRAIANISPALTSTQACALTWGSKFALNIVTPAHTVVAVNASWLGLPLSPSDKFFADVWLSEICAKGSAVRKFNVPLLAPGYISGSNKIRLSVADGPGMDQNISSYSSDTTGSASANVTVSYY